MDNTLFLYLDILGFSEIINDSTRTDRLFKIIDSARIHEDSNFKAIVFSDTIVAYHKNSNLRPPYKAGELMFLIEFAQDIFYRLIGSGIFFRAIITEGPFKYSKLEHIDSYYGKALVDAHKAEKGLNGTGLFLNRKLRELNLVFTFKSYSPDFDYIYLTQVCSRLSPNCDLLDVDLIEALDADQFPLLREEMESTETNYFIYPELMHLKEVYDNLTNHAVPRIREKYLTTWHLYTLAYPGLIETLVKGKFSPTSICDCDWTGPRKIYEEEREL